MKYNSLLIERAKKCIKLQLTNVAITDKNEEAVVSAMDLLIRAYGDLPPRPQDAPLLERLFPNFVESNNITADPNPSVERTSVSTILTLDRLLLIAGKTASTKRIKDGYRSLVQVLAYYQINSPRRIAHFLAQILHESGGFNYTKELGKHAGSQYEGRKDLGNTVPGDGERFCGRGLVQITGRANYESFKQSQQKMCDDLGLTPVDVIAHPEALESFPLASYVAGWFWDAHHLNGVADISAMQTLGKITRIINGGLNGFKSRQGYYIAAKRVLGVID